MLGTTRYAKLHRVRLRPKPSVANRMCDLRKSPEEWEDSWLMYKWHTYGKNRSYAKNLHGIRMIRVPSKSDDSTSMIGAVLATGSRPYIFAGRAHRTCRMIESVLKIDWRS
jgi:hypothetical protein